MKRNYLLLLLILGLSACQFLPGQAPTATALPPAASAAPTPTDSFPPTTIPIALSTSTQPPVPSASAVVAAPILLVSQAIADANTNPAYTFKVHYPQIDSASSSAALTFNQMSKKMAEDLLASYQKNLKSYVSTPDPVFSPSFMETDYQVIHGTDGLLSILFSVSDYWSGAAHPNSYSMVMNFNLITGKPIVLKDLFLPNVNYLQFISDYCAADLKKRDRLEFPEGVLPKAENFQNWVIADQGLIFYFDPYQVAAYAMGPSQVVVPYAALKNAADPAGPLAVYLK
jgi:hypothetical protein